MYELLFVVMPQYIFNHICFYSKGHQDTAMEMLRTPTLETSQIAALKVQYVILLPIALWMVMGRRELSSSKEGML
jgi:hypothetical protein